MIKAVIFDIDNTLYDYDKANETALDVWGLYASKTFGMTPKEAKELADKCIGIVAERTGNCAAQHSRVLRYQCFLEQIGSTDYWKAVEMHHVYWDALLKAMEPEPGLLDLIRRLKQRGIQIGVGSNMTAYVQFQKLEKLGVMPYVDFIVVSEEAGAEKPARRFFELCLKKAGCKPEECVFIGDNLEHDVSGSMRCGMAGVWYRPKKTGQSGDALPEPFIKEGAADYFVITSFEEYMQKED